MLRSNIPLSPGMMLQGIIPVAERISKTIPPGARIVAPLTFMGYRTLANKFVHLCYSGRFRWDASILLVALRNDTPLRRCDIVLYSKNNKYR